MNYFKLLEMAELKVFLHFALVAAFVLSVSCITGDDRSAMRRTVYPIAEECLKKCGLKEIQTVKGDIDPCLKKCVVKKLKVLDDNNQLDRKILHELFVVHIADEVESADSQKRYEECYDEENKNLAEDSEVEMKRVDILCNCLKVAL